MGKFGNFFPGMRMLREYQISWLPRDIAAGLTVGAVMVPVSLAFGDLAGLPLAGLYASIFPLIAYALFGSSRQLIIGPDASMAALVAVSVTPLAAGDMGKLAVMAGMLALLVGAILIISSFMRLGFMADFLAKQVIVGFMHGLALVIVAGQLPKVLGFKGDGETTLQQFVSIGRHFEQTQWIPLAIGASCVAIILGFKRWLPRIPGQIVALVGAILAVYLLDLESHGVSVVGLIPEGLPAFRLPLPEAQDIYDLIPVAFAAALVAFSDSLVTARSFASRNRYRLDANQEMLALGFGNIAAGLSQGLPVSSSGSRTAVAESAGSRTQMTSVFAALMVASTMLFLTPLLYYLPQAALGGILLAAAYNLCEFGEFPRMWRFRGLGLIGSLLTLAGVIGLGIMQGIAIGVLYSLVLVIRALAYPHDAILGRSETGFHDMNKRPDARPIPGFLLYRFSGPLFFANCGLFRTRVEGLINEAKDPVRTFVLDGSIVFEVDLAGCELLSEMRSDFQARGVDFRIANLRDRVREILYRGWPEAKTQNKIFFPTMSAAVDTTD